MLLVLKNFQSQSRFLSSLVRQANLKTMKLESSRMARVLTPELLTLSEIFSRHGYELRIAGGAVRDLLMDKTPSDIDFATTATPEQMKKMFDSEEIRMINNQGEKHGTITARIDDKENFEVTTLRIDKVTDGRRAEVEFTTDWKLDSNRRDLTINSMFLDLDGVLYDYFMGHEDLEKKSVRFVGVAEERIQEDYLRILRYFRFYGRISLDSDNHESETITAIAKNVSGMERISGERIWMEWKKILNGKFSKELTLKMISVGLAPYIGLPTSPNVTQFESVLSRCEELEICLEPTAKLAALLDTEEQVMALHNRLKLSGLERDLCLFVVSNRVDMEDKSIRPYQFLAVDSKLKPENTRMFLEQVLKYRGDTKRLQEFLDWTIPRFGVTGHHLKEAGCPSGKIMSVVLAKLKEEWKLSDFTLETHQLISQIPRVLENIDLKQMQELSSPKSKKKKQKV